MSAPIPEPTTPTELEFEDASARAQHAARMAVAAVPAETAQELATACRLCADWAQRAAHAAQEVAMQAHRTEVQARATAQQVRCNANWMEVLSTAANAMARDEAHLLRGRSRSPH
jgi:hypothetical protein